MKTTNPTVTIDEEFRSLIDPLSQEEYAQLLANIQRDGCRDPLVVWLTPRGRILLDGHNRHGICTEHNKKFTIVELLLADRNAALAWICDNQLGRRNLTPERMSYLRGKKFGTAKRREGRPEKLPQNEGVKSAPEKLPQNEGVKSGTQETAQKIAKETGVSRATIERDAQYAAAVDKLSDAAPEAKAALLSGAVPMSRAAAPAVAALPPAQLKSVARKVAAGKVDSVEEAIAQCAPEALKPAPKSVAAFNRSQWNKAASQAQELYDMLNTPRDPELFQVKRKCTELLSTFSEIPTKPKGPGNGASR